MLGDFKQAHLFSLEKKFKLSFHVDWKNVQKLINVQGQIRSCRVEVGPKLDLFRHTRVISQKLACLSKKKRAKKGNFPIDLCPIESSFKMNVPAVASSTAAHWGVLFSRYP